MARTGGPCLLHETISGHPAGGTLSDVWAPLETGGGCLTQLLTLQPLWPLTSLWYSSDRLLLPRSSGTQVSRHFSPVPIALYAALLERV